ncbi:hypothetical protein ACFQH6_05460 [Halobacteriaceae archaeon GCM10025711]
MATVRFTGRSATGLVIVLIGLLLLLGTTGTVDTTGLVQWIPSLFVLLGLWALVASGFRNLTGPLVVITVAGGWQLYELGVVTAETLTSWWPLLVVVFGASLVLSRWRRESAPAAHPGDQFSAFSLFGGVERRVTARTFVGGDVVSVFGAAEIDLTDAVVETPPASVDVFAAFGGADIRVPEGWDVRLDVVPIFGGTEDKRRTGGTGEGTPDLVVTGLVLFGGVTLKD